MEHYGLYRWIGDHNKSTKVDKDKTIRPMAYVKSSITYNPGLTDSKY